MKLVEVGARQGGRFSDDGSEVTAAQREPRAPQGSNLGQGPCGLRAKACWRQVEKGAPDACLQFIAGTTGRSCALDDKHYFMDR